MNVDDALRAVEATSTAAEFALCNDMHDFAVVARSLPVVDRLRQMASGDTAIAEKISARIEALLAEEGEPATRHPFDHAIALYLLVLSWTNVRLLAPPVQSVIQSGLPNLWFSVMAALDLRNDIPKTRDDEVSKLSIPEEQAVEGWSYVA